MSELQVLKDARHRLMEVGWTQGMYVQYGHGENSHLPGVGPETGYCLVGAMCAGIPAMPWTSKAMGFHSPSFAKARDLLCALLGISTDALAEWNDTRVSKLEVIALLDKAIDLLEDDTHEEAIEADRELVAA